MSDLFAGKVAVVTGAGSGLGKASAQRLAFEGAHIVAIDVNRDTVEKVVAELPTQSVAVEADVSDESAVQHYMDVATSTFDRVDFYHLNAGIFGSFASLPNLSVEEFDRVISVNVRGQFLGLRSAFRQFAEQGTVGSIVV